jgi:hypothetical protein
VGPCAGDGRGDLVQPTIKNRALALIMEQVYA